MVVWAAFLYAGLALVITLFQFALGLGVPWGHLAMGGRWPGRFPPLLRVAAVAQGGLIVAMGWLVAAHAGLIAPLPPRWTLWAVLGLTALTTLLNLATPSLPERRLWGPVTLIMLVCVIRVVMG